MDVIINISLVYCILIFALVYVLFFLKDKRLRSGMPSDTRLNQEFSGIAILNIIDNTHHTTPNQENKSFTDFFLLCKHTPYITNSNIRQKEGEGAFLCGPNHE